MAYFKNARFIRLLTAFLIVITLFVTWSVTAYAAQTANDVPYTSYSFWDGYSDKKAVSDRSVYEVHKVIDANTLSLNGISDIQDICFGKDGFIYMLDSENGRVIVLNSDFTFNRSIDSFYADGKESPLNKPQGIYVQTDGNIYIADTENMRLICCDAQGNILNEIKRPESDVVPEDLDYYPIKVIKDNKGFTYLLTRGSYYGAMVFDTNGAFTGFYGSNLVESGIVASFQRAFKRMFTGNEKLKNQAKKLPYQFMDLCVDTNDFMYTVSPNNNSGVGQVRKVSPGGSNILRRVINFSSDNSDTYNWGEPEIYRLPTSKKSEQNISSLAVDADGYMYVLDKAYGKIYVYDSSCRSVTCFGGGYGNGVQRGLFTRPGAIEVVNGYILVSDTERQNITVFSRTEYGEKLFKANTMTLNGDYAAAEPIWLEVLSLSENSQLTYRGLTKAAMSGGRLNEAMKYAEIGLDQESYSIVFEQILNKYIENNLWWIFIAIALTAAAAITVRYILKRKNIILIKNFKVKNAFGVLVHPGESFGNIKTKNAGSVTAAAVFTVLLFVIKVAGELWGGFMYVIPDAENINSLMILAGTAGLVLLWSVVNWLLTGLMEGKGTLKEIFIVTGYSVQPLIIYYAAFIIFSQFVIPGNINFLEILKTICFAAMIILMLAGHMQIHDMDFKKAVKSSVITLLGMGLAIFILFVIYTLIQSFAGFIVNVISEVTVR